MRRLSKWTVEALLLSDDLAKLIERNRIQELEMSDGYNKVILIGNLAADPEMRYTANGKAVTSFRLAVSRTFNGKQETEWCSCVAWEKQAELVAAHLTKGRQCHVEGRLATRSWDGPDGNKRYKTEIVVSNVLFLGSGQRRDDGDSFGEEIDPDELPFE